MKKVMKIIGMMCMGALLVLGASSCKKDKTEKFSSFDIGLPAIEGESGIDDDSKAYIDLLTGEMKWYDGDNVMMYSLAPDYTQSQAYVFYGDENITGATQAHFTGFYLPEHEEGGFFAFYPASKASSEIQHDNRVAFNVDSIQTWETDFYVSNPSYVGRVFMDPRCVVGAATSDIIDNHAVFNLEHIFGYLNIRIMDASNSGKYVKSVTITDKNLHLTGSMSVKILALNNTDLLAMKGYGITYRDNPSMAAETYWGNITEKLQKFGYKGNGTGYSVTLDCSAANGGNGVPIISKKKYFLMSLRPGALMNGFTITLKFGDNSTKSYEVGPNHQYITIPGTYTVISIDLAQTKGGL